MCGAGGVGRAGLRWVGPRVGAAGLDALVPCRPRFWVRGGGLGGRECVTLRGAGSCCGLGHPVCRWVRAVGGVVSSLSAVSTCHSYCGGVSSLRCASSRVVTKRWSPFVFQGSIRPSSGLHTAVAATSVVMIAVVGAPAISAVVPTSILPVSERYPGVPHASGFSVAWDFFSGSGVIRVPVAVPPGSVASVSKLQSAISSSAGVAATVHPGSSVVFSAIEASVCGCVKAHRGWG